MQQFCMLLHHYSGSKIGEIVSKRQRGMLKHYAKPDGLWVSVVGDNDWLSTQPGELLDHNQYEIALADVPNIRFIDSRKQLAAFTKTYGILPFGETWIAIDWARVATDYQGIIIAPYIAEHTLDDALFWYGAWGCASGCIWDKEAIADATLTREGDPFLGLKYLPRLFED